MKKIGFIGLGHMGLPMAINLLKAGFTVIGFDLQLTALENFIAAGGGTAKTLPEIVASADIILTMLQTGDQVKSVLIDSGIFQLVPKETLFIDCSTIDIESAVKLHQEAARFQFDFVDAPVSGGVKSAEAATLTIMVGGTEAAYSRALPILEIVSKKTIHTGPAGSGQAAKICNNHILGISMIAISEAFLLAKKLGLSPQKLHEVVSNSSGQCWAMTHYVPVAGVLDDVPANHHYQPGFTAAMMLKDLRLSQMSAQSVGVSTPLGKEATGLYQHLIDRGMGGLDFSAIIQDME